MTKFITKDPLISGTTVSKKPFTKTVFTRYFNGTEVLSTVGLQQPDHFDKVYHLHNINGVDTFLAVQWNGECLIYSGVKGDEQYEGE